MKKIRRVLAFLVAAAMIVASVSCKKEVTAEDLMVNVEEGDASEIYLDDTFCDKYCAAAFAMLSHEYSADGPNVVISPLSVYYNLALLANGATGETKSQLEKMLDKYYPTDSMNTYMHSFMENLHDTDTAKFYFDSAIWANSDKNVDVSDEFLAAAKTFYKASAYKESFGETAVNNINNWASNKTNMYSERILKDMPSDAPLYLANYALLDADWESPISPENVLDGKFKAFGSEEQDVQMMSSYESTFIGQEEEVRGFIKNYAGGNYAFLAIIPMNENKSAIANYIDFLSKDKYYQDLIKKRKEYRVVDASIPKFSCEYTGGLKSMLEDMELGNIFNSQYAGLDQIGSSDEKLYVGDISVSTGLTVTEKGTRKGTGANVGNTGVGTNVIPISLNRPFIFAVVDTKRYLPIIVGAVNSVKD